ncbi:MAG: restriction endonuclease subunit S [Cytophagales bacterium]
MNWEVKKLSEIATTFEDGNWIESKDQSPNGIRLVQTGNVGNGKFKDRRDKARYISEETFKKLRCTEIYQGDILVSRLPDPVGRACILPETGDKMITAVDCTIIRLNPNKVLPKWLLYYTTSDTYQYEIQKRVTGATRQRISRKNLGLIPIPVAPLSEQQGIVSILDQAFAAIDKAKANAEQNLQNAKELFDSFSDTIPADKVKLGSIVTIKTGKLNANTAKEDGDYPFFTCSREVFNIDNYAFDQEAVLLAGNNASGDFNVKHYKGKFNAYQRTYVIAAENDEMVSNKYLYYQLQKSLKEFKRIAIGANTRFLKLGMIQNLQIPLPSYSEQMKLVQTFDSLLAETQKLEAVYQKKIDDLEELKKSILQKAFAGELETEKAVVV